SNWSASGTEGTTSSAGREVPLRASRGDLELRDRYDPEVGSRERLRDHRLSARVLDCRIHDLTTVDGDDGDSVDDLYLVFVPLERGVARGHVLQVALRHPVSVPGELEGPVRVEQYVVEV